MCLNCGCGEPDLRHTDTDLVRQDVLDAAEGQGLTVDETIFNLETSFQELRTDAGDQSTPR
jgi:hypothetical protein